MEFSRNIDTEKMSRRQRERIRRVQVIIEGLQQTQPRPWPVIERPDAAQLPLTTSEEVEY